MTGSVSFRHRGVGPRNPMSGYLLNYGTASVPVAKFGASAGSVGAINIDASIYATIAVNVVNGTRRSYMSLTNSGLARFGGGTATAAFLVANDFDKWYVPADAGGTSTFVSNEVTARIVGGSSNGLSVRNSAQTRDNVNIADAGDVMTLANGSFTARVAVSSAAGELLSGARFGGGDASTNAFLIPNAGGQTGLKAGVVYYNQTTWLSALEVAHVASGFATLALMKSGGAVVVGADPGGGGVFRLTGTCNINGIIAGQDRISSSHPTAGIGYATGAGGTVTQATSRTTGVTLNKVCGTITLFSTTLAADTTQSFTLTNSAIAAGDQVICQHTSGGTVGIYAITASATAAGSCTINVRNISPAISASEAPVITFVVIKAVTA